MMPVRIGAVELFFSVQRNAIWTATINQCQNEPWHDKTYKMSVRPAKTQISLGIRPVWSES